MEIRTLIHDDLTALLELYTHLHEELYDAKNEAFSRVWNNIQDAGNILYFGVFVELQLVSSCHLVIVPNLTHVCHPYAVIENVVTHSAHRNKGYGTAVLNAATQFAWEQGCYKVMLMTGRKDAAVHDFYENAGFKMDDKKAFVARPK